MNAIGLLGSDAVESFAVFARHRNFTSAAAELHISQPSLHVKIKKLSAALGRPLYERQGRALILTDTGRQLAAFAADSRRSIDDFTSQLDTDSTGVRIATGRGALRWILGDAIAAPTGQHQRIQLTIGDRATVLDAVLTGGADLGVLAFDRPPPELEQILISSFPQVLLIPKSHPLARCTELALADLDGLHLVAPPLGRPHRSALDRAMLDAGVRIEVTAEVDGWDLLAHLAGLGIGAAVVNGCVEPGEGLAAIPITDLPATRYWAAWRPHRRSAATAFLDRLVIS